MPRKRPEHPDDDHGGLAPPVTPHQLAELRRLGYKGPTPSTAPQAEWLLQQQRAGPRAPREDGP
jgi:hypothetical protein